MTKSAAAGMALRVPTRRMKYLYLVLSGLLLGQAAHAQQWFSLVGRDSRQGTTLVEVDLDTVRLRGGSSEAVIRVSHDAPHTHAEGFNYLSFIATAQIDCHRQHMSLSSAAYFAQARGQGTLLGADSPRQNGIPGRLLQTIPPDARQALLKAACPATPPS